MFRTPRIRNPFLSRHTWWLARVLACVAVTPLGAAPASAPASTASPEACSFMEDALPPSPASSTLTAHERSIVHWLVQQILHAKDDDAALEFTEADIACGLGIDVRGLDRRRIQEHLRHQLARVAEVRSLELLD